MRRQTCINARTEGMIPTVLEIPSKENPYDPAKVALLRRAAPLILNTLLCSYLSVLAFVCMHAARHNVSHTR